MEIGNIYKNTSVKGKPAIYEVVEVNGERIGLKLLNGYSPYYFTDGIANVNGEFFTSLHNVRDITDTYNKGN